MKRNIRKVIIFIFLIWVCQPFSVQASETPEQSQSEIQEELLNQFDFQEIERFLDELFPDDRMGFLDTVKGLMTGEVELTAELLLELISDQFLYEFKNAKTSIVHMLALVIIAAVFHNFSGVFQNNQVSELSFYVIYMLLITISLNSFQVLIEGAALGLERLLEFLKILGPVYFLAVTIATGSATSIAFYNMILILICIVELVILNVLLPMVQLYMVIRILNNLSSEEYLSKFGELLHTVIVWSLRTLLGGVIGINLIQGLLNPAIDSVKRSVLTKSGEAIPVVGDAIGGAAEVVLGTAVLIKNGIGVAGAVICIIICMAPVIQMAVVALMYKLTAALIQPISEKRVVGCISSIADGTEILLRIVFTSGILFLITIAMVANTTS